METSCKNLVKENQDWKGGDQESLQQIAIEMYTTRSNSNDNEEGEDDEKEEDLLLKIMELPDSIFLHIFGYLPFSDIGRVAQVCHRWSQVSADELLWKEIFLRHYNLPLQTKMSFRTLSWRAEFKRLYYHAPCLLSEERKEHRDEVLHVSFSHDGTMFATCSKDGFFKVWECGQPCRLLFEKDMMSSFSWKFTQFSQFNETDTCLLVSGVYFGSLSTAGEIAVFNLQDDFHMQCRVTNKPYDVFGAWYDNDHLLSGTLYWTGDFNSISAVWLSKASQEVESEMESVSMVLYRFENHNSSSIRLLHIAEVEQEDEKDSERRCRCMDHGSCPLATVIVNGKGCEESTGNPGSCSDLSHLPSAGVGSSIHGNEATVGTSLLDKLLKKSIAENEFDLENEDDSEWEEEKGENREAKLSNNLVGKPLPEAGEGNNLVVCDSGNCSNSNTIGIRECDDYFDENLIFGDEDYEIQYSIFGELKQKVKKESCSNKLEMWTPPAAGKGQGLINCESRGGYSSRQCGGIDDDNEAKLVDGGGFMCDTDNLCEKVNSLVNGGDIKLCSDSKLKHLQLCYDDDKSPCASGKEGFDFSDIDNDEAMREQNCNCCNIEEKCSEINEEEEVMKQQNCNCNSNMVEKMCFETEVVKKRHHQFAPTETDLVERRHDLRRSDHERRNCTFTFEEEENSNMDMTEVMDSQTQRHDFCCELPQNFPPPPSTLQDDNDNNNLTGPQQGDTVCAGAELCTLTTGNVATQTEESACAARLAAGNSIQMSMSGHSSSLSREVVRRGTSTEKLLIYTWGSHTYIPHKIGIKRIKRSDFCKGEVKARQSSMLLPDVMENLHSMSEDRRDTPDVSIDMHGHIVGLSLSPDQRYLYVNCRAWPKNYIISDPQESPPLAQEVEISTIDLITFQFVGPVLRSHKAYTHSDECFFLNLDVSEDFVVSGAENKKGYIWDRHYGICLGQFDHRSVVNSMAICPSDPEIAVSVSDDHTYKVWMSRSKMKEAERTGKPVNRLTHRNSFESL